MKKYILHLNVMCYPKLLVSSRYLNIAFLGHGILITASVVYGAYSVLVAVADLVIVTHPASLLLLLNQHVTSTLLYCFPANVHTAKEWYSSPVK